MFLISPLHHLHFVKYLMSLKVYHYGNKIPAPHPPIQMNGAELDTKRTKTEQVSTISIRRKYGLM